MEIGQALSEGIEVSEDTVELIRDIYIPMWRFVYWHAPIDESVPPAPRPSLSVYVWDDEEAAFVERFRPPHVQLTFTRIVDELSPVEQLQWQPVIEERSVRVWQTLFPDAVRVA